MRLKYFTCAEGGQHEGEVMNLVCINKRCPKPGLLCSICKADHPSHTVLPLKSLLAELKDHR